MLKIKTLAIVTVTLFLLINTTYFWEVLLGQWIMLVYGLMVIAFIFLVIAALIQTFLTIKDRLRFKPRIYLLSFMVPLLVLTYLKPFGIINFYKYEKEDKLTAYQLGVANCTTTLKLKDNNKFLIRSICFGVGETSGTYTLKKDTIKFEYSFLPGRGNGDYKFAILDTASKTVRMYRTNNDKQPYPLHVITNGLK